MKVCTATLGLAEAVSITFDRLYRVAILSKKGQAYSGKTTLFQRQRDNTKDGVRNFASLKRKDLEIGQQWPSE